MNTNTIIKAKGLQKTYAIGTVNVHALRGVDLTVAKGQMVAIMGPSGCGKTTLLNCLAGLDEPTEGSVLIEGVPLNDLSDDARTEYRARRLEREPFGGSSKTVVLIGGPDEQKTTNKQTHVCGRDC
jgi:putative ABC transport system ATP-binding protein